MFECSEKGFAFKKPSDKSKSNGKKQNECAMLFGNIATIKEFLFAQMLFGRRGGMFLVTLYKTQIYLFYK